MDQGVFRNMSFGIHLDGSLKTKFTFSFKSMILMVLFGIRITISNGQVKFNWILYQLNDGFIQLDELKQAFSLLESKKTELQHFAISHINFGINLNFPVHLFISFCSVIICFVFLVFYQPYKGSYYNITEWYSLNPTLDSYKFYCNSA